MKRHPLLLLFLGIALAVLARYVYLRFEGLFTIWQLRPPPGVNHLGISPMSVFGYSWSSIFDAPGSFTDTLDFYETEIGRKMSGTDQEVCRVTGREYADSSTAVCIWRHRNGDPRAIIYFTGRVDSTSGTQVFIHAPPAWTDRDLGW